jgi:hypothetical protein
MGSALGVRGVVACNHPHERAPGPGLVVACTAGKLELALVLAQPVDPVACSCMVLEEHHRQAYH